MCDQPVDGGYFFCGFVRCRYRVLCVGVEQCAAQRTGFAVLKARTVFRQRGDELDVAQFFVQQVFFEPVFPQRATCQYLFQRAFSLFEGRSGAGLFLTDCSGFFPAFGKGGFRLCQCLSRLFLRGVFLRGVLFHRMQVSGLFFDGGQMDGQRFILRMFGEIAVDVGQCPVVSGKVLCLFGKRFPVDSGVRFFLTVLCVDVGKLFLQAVQCLVERADLLPERLRLLAGFLALARQLRGRFKCMGLLRECGLQAGQGGFFRFEGLPVVSLLFAYRQQCRVLAVECGGA